ncbi:hypothetical protein SLEP1_g19211 [Rubroshorea leprosula]|nr:hypothetical protein SLEP1_g19211 [Rubroshorea leprosula]
MEIGSLYRVCQSSASSGIHFILTKKQLSNSQEDGRGDRRMLYVQKVMNDQLLRCLSL